MKGWIHNSRTKTSTALAALSTVLMVACIGHPAIAETKETRRPLPREFQAINPYERAAPYESFDGALHGPTHDTLSSATGGPSGGLPDKN